MVPIWFSNMAGVYGGSAYALTTARWSRFYLLPLLPSKVFTSKRLLMLEILSENCCFQKPCCLWTLLYGNYVECAVFVVSVIYLLVLVLLYVRCNCSHSGWLIYCPTLCSNQLLALLFWSPWCLAIWLYNLFHTFRNSWESFSTLSLPNLVK